jgi:hypothetical protein
VNNRYTELLLERFTKFFLDKKDIYNMSDDAIVDEFIKRYSISDKEIQKNVKEFLARQIKE